MEKINPHTFSHKNDPHTKDIDMSRASLRAVQNVKEGVGINLNRRSFIKWLGLGAGAIVAFLAGKILGPSFSIFGDKATKPGEFKNFRFVEDDKELKLYNRMGDEIFVLEKDVLSE